MEDGRKAEGATNTESRRVSGLDALRGPSLYLQYIEIGLDGMGNDIIASECILYPEHKTFPLHLDWHVHSQDWVSSLVSLDTLQVQCSDRVGLDRGLRSAGGRVYRSSRSGQQGRGLCKLGTAGLQHCSHPETHIRTETQRLDDTGHCCSSRVWVGLPHNKPSISQTPTLVYTVRTRCRRRKDREGRKHRRRGQGCSALLSLLCSATGPHCWTT